VEFDQPLFQQLLNTGNWTLYRSGRKRRMNTVNVVTGKVFAQTYDFGPTFKPDSVDFDPPPPDVMNLDLVPAAAFYGFPLS
jgi:hypothetical protein